MLMIFFMNFLMILLFKLFRNFGFVFRLFVGIFVSFLLVLRKYLFRKLLRVELLWRGFLSLLKVL